MTYISIYMKMRKKYGYTCYLPKHDDCSMFSKVLENSPSSNGRTKQATVSKIEQMQNYYANMSSFETDKQVSK